MIILDEQISKLGMQRAIAAWYPGSVRFVRELRPNTIIKDEAMETLLAREAQPTFVTINVNDFWNVIPASAAYCVICVDVPATQINQVLELTRKVLRHLLFRSKAQRMGKVIKVTTAQAQFYAVGESAFQTVGDWR